MIFRWAFHKTRIPNETSQFLEDTGSRFLRDPSAKCAEKNYVIGGIEKSFEL